MLKDIIEKNRSCRRFDQSVPIDKQTIVDFINMARLSASAANLQPLKYIILNTPEKNASIFPALTWAGYLQDWPCPEQGQRPAAYIIILGDSAIAKNYHCDHGIAAQSILLGAVEKGLAGCMLGAIDRPAIKDALKIPDQFEILLVIALGVPAEKIITEDTPSGGSIKYYRDSDGTHHVPKRKLDDIILDL